MNYILREAWDVLKNPGIIPKLPNMMRASASYALNKLTRKNIVWGYPFVMMVEPTNICNLRCPLCITGSKLMTRDDGMMTLERFKQLMDEMGPYLMHLTLWSQGEPFVNRDFVKMIRYAHDKHIKTVTSTNGHFLSENAEAIVESGLDTLIIAVDGASQDTYEKYRVNGKFEKVFNGMKAIAAAKTKLKRKTPAIELQFIVMKHNEHELETIRQMAHECHVQVLSLKTAQVYTAEQALEFLPNNEKYRRYEIGNDGTFAAKIGSINFCRWVLMCPVINWDGTVSPCCFDKNADYPLGNVFDPGGMKTIWKNKAYHDFRRRIFTQRSAIPICSNCSEGLEVEVYEKELIPSRPASAVALDHVA
ncbi:MAG TPA: radical SAM protein [bacterium]|nr:radical SAM protein [bacterium]HND78474.1 radical SAM protein [bacterium]HNF86339.1 radical SAM protein [bacterium]